MLRWPRSIRQALALYKNNVTSSTPKTGDRVVVAMSGGVDSSVVAAMLARKDYDLSAVYMRNWDTRDESGTDSGCEWKKDWIDVQRVCKALDIPCEMVDLSREYWTRVFEPALKVWEDGGTPSPDIGCNREVKFGALYEHLAAKTSWIATGHYAKVLWDRPSLSSHIFSNKPPVSRPKLMRPNYRPKDQTYYLSSITEHSLAQTLFPLADLSKPAVRSMALEWKLPTAQREESMGICFVGEKRRFGNFLSNYIPPNPGHIIELTTNKILGTHQGLWTYTIGEGARISGMPHRMVIAKKDVPNNVIYVAPVDHPALYSRGMIVKNWQWIWTDYAPSAIDASAGFHARVQHRYRMEDVPCIVRRGASEGTMEITFREPEKAVTPGQVAVLYKGDWCLGSGVIAGTID